MPRYFVDFRFRRISARCSTKLFSSNQCCCKTDLKILTKKIEHSAGALRWCAMCGTALHCNANVFTRNHLDLWGVISQTSTIGVGQWQMHLSTSRRPPPKATWWSNGIHSKLTWKMTSLSNLEPMCRYHLTCFDIYESYYYSVDLSHSHITVSIWFAVVYLVVRLQ